MKPLFWTLVLACAAVAQTPIVTQPRAPISNLPATTAPRVQLLFGSAVLGDVKYNPAKPLQIDGPPGLYTLRFVGSDKARTPVGTPLSVLIPGILKTPGQWLFPTPSTAGFPFVAPATQWVSAPAKFLPDLRANAKAKPPVFTLTPLIQEWATVPVNADLTLPALPNQTPKSGFYVGYELSPTATTTVESLRALRVAIEARNPGAALILSVRAQEPGEAARQLDLFGPLCDAVKIEFSLVGPTPIEQQLWPLKVARRVAEEREQFDLPIFAALMGENQWTSQFAAEIYAHGATGLLGSPNSSGFDALYSRNLNWLLGAVTLEDAAIHNAASAASPGVASQLRAAGRIPLLGRTPAFTRGNPEPIFAVLDEQTTEKELEGLRSAANAGQTVYLQGLPPRALWEKFGGWTSLKISALPLSKTEVLTLDDIWFWGTANAREYAVNQSVSVTILDSLAAKARDEKGVARETKPRAIGALTGDPNGILLAPVGKGRILWAPHAFVKADPKPEFFAAIAGAMQPALLSVEGADWKTLRIALRQSANGTPLVWAFNTAPTSQNLTFRVRAQSEYALDLQTETPVKTALRGFTTTFSATVAPGSYGVWALPASRENFEKERKTAPFKAQLR